MTPLASAFLDLQEFFESWKLTAEQITRILGVDEEVYQSWLLSGAMGFEPRIITRCSECYALHKALLLHFKEDRAFAWVQRPNTAALFHGRTAIQTICEEIEVNPRIIRDIIVYVRAKTLR